MSNPKNLIIITISILVVIIIFLVLFLLRKHSKKLMLKKVNNLDIIKNDILSLFP